MSVGTCAGSGIGIYILRHAGKIIGPFAVAQVAGRHGKLIPELHVGHFFPIQTIPGGKARILFHSLPANWWQIPCKRLPLL